MWSLAGCGLLTAGCIWIFESRSPAAIPVLLLALAAGALKARYVLDRTARRTTARIESRGDGRCLGGFLSWKSWLLVAAMILLGRLLRASPLPLLARGGIYAAIGSALLIASRTLWTSRRDLSAARRGPVDTTGPDLL
jgi:uncharacterized membrane protein